MPSSPWSVLVDAYLPGLQDQDALDEQLRGLSRAELEGVLRRLGQQIEGGPVAADSVEWAVLGRIFVTLARLDHELGALVGWVDEHGAPLSRWQVYKLANRVAWSTRGADTALEPTVSTPGERFALYVALERKRFAFDDRAIGDILNRTDVAPELWDVVLASLSLFREVRRATTDDDVRPAIERVLGREDARAYAEVPYDVIAHGLWLNLALEPRGELLALVCRRWVDTVPGHWPVADFRYAAALRGLGRYEEAIERAEKALAQLGGSSEFARTFSEQCISEREMSIVGLGVRRSQSSLDGTIEELRAEIRQLERRSVTRVVEVLTLFTAAAAFALGGISVVSGLSSSPGQLLVVMSGFACGLVLFSLLVVVSLEITAGEAAPPWRLVGVAGLVLAVCAILMIGSVLVAGHVD